MGCGSSSSAGGGQESKESSPQSPREQPQARTETVPQEPEAKKSPTPKTEQTKSTEDNFISENVAAHNKFRAMHGVEPLTHAQDISDIAQKWADHLAKADIFEHSPGDKRKGLGENIWFGWRSDDPCGPEFSHDVTEAVKSFYDEIKDYDFNDGKFSMDCGHFTQVVWKGSKEVGMGWARSKKNNVYMVCNYRPPGNYTGQFGENVPPPL